MRALLLALLCSTAPAILASSQAPPAPLASIPAIQFDTSGPVLRAPVEPQKPFTVAGPHGVLLGRQDGSLEAWILPVKLFSNLTIEASIAGYPVPIDLNQHAATIEVRPDRTIITYSHLGLTVRQIMFSPGADLPVTKFTSMGKNTGAPVDRSSSTGWSTGPLILYQFDCLHPSDFTFRFTPELQWMWPARTDGVPGVEWEPHPFRTASTHPPAAGSSSSGLYVLHTDYPDLAAAVTIPGAEPGILTPYQERPQVHPVELRLHIDPARDNGRLFPLLMAVGTDPASATSAALALSLEHLNAAIPAQYTAEAQHYRDILAYTTSIETPDQSLNQAFQWAVLSVEQLRTSVFEHSPSPEAPEATHTIQDPPSAQALVAGYFASADSVRPGFGWFFGRDALYTLYAVNGFGDFALTGAQLDFLIRRQRTDGNIMHEYSQTAPLLDWWPGFPYMYAAADSTPLFLLAMADYLRASGDTAFLTARRDAIEKAWAFETDPAHDANHDGVYDNSQGTGWVESWPGGLPHQEIYLALLDQQASSAYAYIERTLKDPSKAESADRRAAAIAKTINATYYDAAKGCYAFSTNPANTPNGPLDRTTTIYPALAWWDPSPEFGSAAESKSGAPTDRSSSVGILDHPRACLQNFIASSLNTDWGTRDIASTEKIYDGMSYHQGSVWPLFTGWAALAEYRANQPLAGYQLLRENANLTTAQDLGAITELLSGDFFVPFGRSTSHQLWSSAMVITPTLRGLFGISIDAPGNTITVDPHLPADWDHATIRTLHIGNHTANLHFIRNKAAITVTLETPDAGLQLATNAIGARSITGKQQLVIPDHPVRIALDFQPPQPGNRTQSPRVLKEEYGDHTLTLTIEGLAGSDAQFPVVLAAGLRRRLIATGAELISALLPATPRAIALAESPTALAVHFPPAPSQPSSPGSDPRGYPTWQTITVTLTW